MAEDEAPRKTAHTAIIEALEQVEEMEEVLVIWSTKEGKVHSRDNDLNYGDMVYLVTTFWFWLMQNNSLDHHA